LDPYPFVKLAQSGLPPRVRALLEGAYQAAQPIIDSALTRALDELESDLLRHAERTSNAGEQNQCFASVREFRLRRAEFLQACRAGVQRSMLALVDPSVVDEALTIVSPREAAGAANAAREDDLTLSQIATRAEIRASNELQALAYRFGVIAGRPPIEIEKLVLGPYTLCAAFRAAARHFEVIPPHRLALYRRIDKALFAEPLGLYDAVNRYLVDRRVFANLLPSSQSAGAVNESRADAPTATPIDAPVPRQARSAEALAIAPVAELAPTRMAVQAPVPTQAQQTSGYAEDRPVSPATADMPLDAGFFRALLDRQASSRGNSQPIDTQAGLQRPLADRRDLQSVLTLLQAKAPAPLMVGGEWVDRSAGHIRQELLNQLRGRGEGGPPRLSDADSDSIDLVGLLFEQLLRAYRPNSVSRAIVGRLQIPVLKAALGDPDFFARRAHPAQRLVNAVVDCLEEWVDDEDADRQILEKLQMVVDRLIREFDEDVGSFERCRDDLEKHLAGLQRKAEVAERRHVEAAKGREKLDLARAAAEEAVQQQLSGTGVPTAIRELLQDTWSDALALALLRQGVDHPKTAERLAMVDELLQVFAVGQTPQARRAMLERLRPVLEDGLAAVGFHDEAILSAWNDLCALVDARHDQEQQFATRAITELIRQKPRFGGDSVLPAGGVEAMLFDGDHSALDPSERAMVDRIRQLPAGTWFEFTRANGETCRRRLSWYSQATGRCMLLNARGARGDDRGVVQLAREMLLGTARLAPEARVPPIERAWQALAAQLRDHRRDAAPSQPASIR
jgi:hypothetical protein